MSSRGSKAGAYANHAKPHQNGQFSRRWSEPPTCAGFKPIGRAAERVIENTAIRAVQHWLRQADELEGEDRREAIATADEIMRMAGLRWGDLGLRRAA